MSVLNHDIYPVVTMFMLQSVDGKISTGYGPGYDVDSDIPKLNGVKEGISQYYRIEQETDLWSMVTSKTLVKIGLNSGKLPMAKIPGLHRVIVGGSELNENGIRYVADHSEYAHFIVRTAQEYDKIKRALYGSLNNDTLTCTSYGDAYSNPKVYLRDLKKMGCDELTLQGGATLNGAFATAHAIDKVHVVVAPMIVGGKDTPTLVDGDSRTDGLRHINVLKLVEVKQLRNSYIEFIYDVTK